MRLLVLAGGFGTRLKTAVADVPKALAPVGGVPFLQFQLEHWLAQGLCEFTFLLHHQADQIVDFLNSLRAGVLKNCHTDWVIEPTPMETGGALAYAVREMRLTGDLLITNADTWLNSGLKELKQAESPTIAVLKLANVSRYGQVHFDQSARVTAFTEKNSRSEPGWISAGLCRLNADLFKDRDG